MCFSDPIEHIKSLVIQSLSLISGVQSRNLNHWRSAVTITVIVRDRFWAAGLDPCDVAALW
jgi:hypothetical protein